MIFLMEQTSKIQFFSIDKMNSTLTLTTEQAGQGFFVAQFKSSELSIFSYYVESQGQCFLIDPVFDVETYNKFMAEKKSKLKFIFLTHYHADYLSGHTQFNVPIVMGPTASRTVNTFKIKECSEGEVLSLGNIKIKVIHTPGHTPQSSCYLMSDATGKDINIFTGDTVFLGEVGRPDLACSSDITSADLAGMLYDSVQKLKKLDPTLRVYPGHGAGSACGKSIGAGNFCTMAVQNTSNYGFKFSNKADFVKQLTANIAKPPKYFFYDAGLNQKGGTSYDLVLKKAHVPLTIEEFNKLRTQCKVVDTRNIIGQKGIIRGIMWLPSTGPIVNIMSNFISHQEEFIILTEPGKEMDIINRYFRIGYFNIKGYNKFNVEELKDQFVKPQSLNFETLPDFKDRVHIDVRSKPQWTNTGVLEGALLISLPEIESRLDQLKGKKNIVVNCLTGMRSKVAFSILARHNIDSKFFADNFAQMKNKGYKVVQYKG